MWLAQLHLLRIRAAVVHCNDRFVVSASSRSGPLVDTFIGTSCSRFAALARWHPGLRVVSGGAQTALAFAVFGSGFSKNRVVSAGSQSVHAIAGKDEGVFSMLEVIEPDCSKKRVGHSAVGFETVVERSEVAVHANADEHEVSLTSSRFWSLIAARIVMGTWQWSSRLRVGVLRRQRTRLQVEVREFVDFVSLARRCACPPIHLIHPCVWFVFPVHARLLCLRLASSFAFAPASFAVVAHAHNPCMMHTIRGRTRVGFRVPREGGVPKVGFPVRPEGLASCLRGGRQGVNFRPTGGVRVQVAGSLPRRQPGALVPGR